MCYMIVQSMNMFLTTPTVVNNVRHLYTEWEENPAEMIEISKHRGLFPPVGKCSSLSSNSQESICNEETTPGLDSAFIESSNTSLEAETISGDLDSSVNSNTKTASENGTESHCSFSSPDTATQTEPKNTESSSKDQENKPSPSQTTPTHVPAPVTTTSSSKDTSSSSNSPTAAVKHENSKTERQALPRTPRKSPKTLKSSPTVVVVVNGNRSPPITKEGKKNQSNSTSAKKGKESDKKRVTVVIEEIIEKNGDSAGCEKDLVLSQELQDDSRKHSAAKLRQIQQRVRDSLRQQGVVRDHTYFV